MSEEIKVVRDFGLLRFAKSDAAKGAAWKRIARDFAMTWARKARAQLSSQHYGAQAVEDALSQFRIKLFDPKMPPYHGQGSPDAFAQGVLRFTIYEYIRDNPPQGSTEPAPRSRRGRSGGTEQLRQDLTTHRFTDRFRACLRELQPMERLLLTLYVSLGWSSRQIAQTFGEPAVRYHSRCAAAQRKLLKMLEAKIADEVEELETAAAKERVRELVKAKVTRDSFRESALDDLQQDLREYWTRLRDDFSNPNIRDRLLPLLLDEDESDDDDAE